VYVGAALVMSVTNQIWPQPLSGTVPVRQDEPDNASADSQNQQQEQQKRGAAPATHPAPGSTLLAALLLGPPGRLPSLLILPSACLTWLRHCRSLHPIKPDLVDSASPGQAGVSLPLW
jgi:hypothetical protein